VVTVLFCDLVGSTALGESTDPEALRALLARYFERMRGVVEEHGGSVEKFIGDAVMAVFGVPAVHEDDALRACRAAVVMREAFAGLGVEGRIGLSTGEVVTGTEERLATGDALNVAARLQQAALPGEVLIAEATLELVAEAVEVEPVEPLLVKGKREPLAAFRLLAARPASERRHETVFVGRERELALLGEAWAGALAKRRCELVTIVADAGLGKSRLSAEALCVIEAPVVRGRCLPYGAGITYWPVVEVLKQLGALPSDRPRRRRSVRFWGSRRRRRRRRRSPGRSASCSRSRRHSFCSSTTFSGVRRRSSTWSSIWCCSPAALRCWSSASPARSCSRAAPPGR
jgi:class 3 adenylate cyclase